MSPTVTTTLVPTPEGPVRVAVAVDGDGAERLVACAFDDHFDRVAERVRRRYAGDWVEGDTATAAAVQRYVDGDVAALDHVVVDLVGTPFQQQVWDALRTIPVGSTWSYAELAAAVGSPGAVRAVGTANGANPAWLVVPCHRVVRSDGSLGGYGGGVERKAWLLAHERATGHNGGEGGAGPS
ncbi:MAG: methylated-DNA--[protein]-cysteine S-methyltransferase [Acidimicrobiia bacterium]